MKTYFITGTGTAVGKTISTAALARHCLKKGLKTAVMKLVQTGTADGADDLQTIHALVPGLVSLPANLACPCRLPLAASPHLAAKCAGTAIAPARLLKAIHEATAFAAADVLLIEGAGGICVPLTTEYLLLDLMRELGAPVILVALASLGSINHSLLSIHALRNAGLEVAGLIFNQVSGKDDPVEKDNLTIIPILGRVPVLARMPLIMPPTTAHFARGLDQVHILNFQLDAGRNTV